MITWSGSLARSIPLKTGDGPSVNWETSLHENSSVAPWRTVRNTPANNWSRSSATPNSPPGWVLWNFSKKPPGNHSNSIPGSSPPMTRVTPTPKLANSGNNGAASPEKSLQLAPVLSEEQTQGYLRDIISGEADRKSRAIRMLDPHKLKGVASIQEFLVSNPALPASSVIALKEAQYQLVLNQTVPKQAALLARDLTRGNQDQLLGALAALKNTGLFSIPIVRDFVDSPDALIRETAIDSILVIGGSRSVPLVIPSLDKEKDINVIHAAMRRLREIGGSEASDIAVKYLEHESEDMIVSALETLKKLKGGSSRSRLLPSTGSSSKPDASDEKIIALLDDPRWRVRASALEYIDHVRLKSSGPKVIELLSDEDVFVRSNAIDAVVSLKLSSANDTLKKIFLEDDEMIASVTGAFTSMKTVLPEHLIAHLDTRPPDIIVGAIKALDSDDVPFLKIVARYATHQNLDVSCSALRTLGDDYDKVKIEFVSDHLTTALQSGSEEKVAAVLNSLRLPSPNSSSYSSGFSSVFVMPVPTEKTSLDSLYNAFLKKTDKEAEEPKEKAKPAAEPEASGGLATLKETLATFTTPEMWQKNSTHAYLASYTLGRVDNEVGLKSLLSNFDQLTTSQRASVADNFYNLNNPEAITLLTRLMQDDLSEIRKDAAYSIIYNEKNLELVQEGFAQLDLEETRFQAHELYSYNLRSVIDGRKTASFVQKWATQTLTSQNPDPKKILALAIKKNSLSADDVQFVSSYTRSKNQWLRRAAWYALLKSKQSWATENIETLIKDESPLVRVALPMALSSESGIWLHYFDDVNFRNDYSSSSSSRSRSRIILSAAHETTIRELAQHDLSPLVRFESWFSLMAHGKTIDLGAFTSLIGEQAKETKVSYRLAEHIEKNYRRMGKGMAPLLSYADTKRISGRTLPSIVAHFDNGNSKNAFSNFSSLAQAAEVADAPQQLDGVATPEELAKLRKELKVIVFYKPGCKECERAEEHLENFKSEFPLIKLERYNILDQDSLLLNRALCDRFKVVNGSGKTPSFFTQYGAAITPAVKPEMLAELLQSTMETEDDPTWSEFEAEEMEEAKAKVEESFANITLAIVILGGLFDGVNPVRIRHYHFLPILSSSRQTHAKGNSHGGNFIHHRDLHRLFLRRSGFSRRDRTTHRDGRLPMGPHHHDVDLCLLRFPRGRPQPPRWHSRQPGQPQGHDPPTPRLPQKPHSWLYPKKSPGQQLRHRSLCHRDHHFLPRTCLHWTSLRAHRLPNPTRSLRRRSLSPHLQHCLHSPLGRYLRLGLSRHDQ